MTNIANTMGDNTLEKIYNSGLKLLDPLNPQETYRIIVNEALKLVNGDEGRIVLAEKGELHIVYVSSPQAQDITKVRRKGFSYRAFTEHRAFVVNTEKYPKVHPQSIRRGIKSALFIPLSYRRQSLGVLIVQSFKEKNFSNHELNILKLFGSIASLAIRKAQLYEETRSALDTRDLFIALASHELRTPITSISGYVQLLETRFGQMQTTESRWIKELSWECKRLTNLVKELLEVNQMNTGQLQYFFKECNLKDVINRVISNFRFTHPSRTIIFEDLTALKDAKVIGDFDKLMQLTTNLVDNAVKFSPEETPIRVGLCPKGRSFVVQVKNEGAGIDRKDIPKIFHEFYKGQNNLKEGMGLGLFLVKNIATRHHGTVSVTTKPGKGTIFDVLLPKAKI